MAKAIFYLLSTVRGCGIGIISKVYRQLEMLHKHMGRFIGNFPGWKLIEGELIAPNGNWARWFATDSASDVESLHAHFMVAMLDEVKEMDADVVDAVGRWHPSLRIEVSSKGIELGRFYDRFTKDRSFWNLSEVDASQCPWINKRMMEQEEAQLGRNHPYIKSTYYNEWNSSGLNTLIPLNQVQSCVQHPPHHTHNGQYIGGLDLSAGKRGGDECVLMYRLGNKVFDPVVFMGFTDEMAVVGEVVRALRRLKIAHVFADAGGVGGPMISRLAEVLMGKEIVLHRVAFGGKPHSTGGKTLYADRAIEIWQNMADVIESRRIALPKDDKLIGQIATREYKLMSSGARRLISKEEQKEKYGRSPDRADALALALLEPPFVQPNATGPQKPDKYFGSQTIDTFPTAAWEQEDQSKRSSVGFELGG